MPSVAEILSRMGTNPRSITDPDLAEVCEHFFGPPRRLGGSRAAYKTPWPGDPRVNIQDDHARAKAHQVRQVLAAISRKESGS